MGTYFEVILYGEDKSYLRSAGEEALDEVERLEEQMSFYLPTSEICGINSQAAFKPVKVETRLFRLIQRAAQISTETEGAFDITIAPLGQLWRFFGNNATIPDLGEVEAAKSRIGIKHLLLYEKERAVRFARAGMMLDLGGIGKGYAIERAVMLLREKGIASALIHGGTSTIYAIGAPPKQQAWLVGLSHPFEPEKRVALIRLCNKALSASRVCGKFFEANGKRYGHILDPRTGLPARDTISAFVVTSFPTDADALSTAFVVLGVEKVQCYCKKHEEVGALLLTESAEPGGFSVSSFGLTGLLVEPDVKYDSQPYFIV